MLLILSLNVAILRVTQNFIVSYHLIMRQNYQDAWSILFYPETSGLEQ